MITALGTSDVGRLAEHPAVLRALSERNRLVAGFWFAEPAVTERPTTGPVPRRVMVVDAEDTFTAMLVQQLASLGLEVMIRRYDEPYDLDGTELVVMGPGPGDPTNLADPKIATLRKTLRVLLESRRPFLAICLSHQVLCGLLGLPVARLDVPHQGLQREIDYFGRPVRVGFYNTFSASSPAGRMISWAGPVELATDPATGEVHALRGRCFSALQFHPESILTTDGPGILTETLTKLFRATPDPFSAAQPQP